jgi:CO dehydrogenase nickel-insertion accessory protein CooC1
LLGELEANGRTVVFDMEAGMGTLLRLQPGQADVVLAVADPSAKAIEVARRAAVMGRERARVVVVGNRVRGDDDVERIADALAADEVVAVPEEPEIGRAEREGRAPIDVAPDAPGVRALLELAERLAPGRR